MSKRILAFAMPPMSLQTTRTADQKVRALRSNAGPVRGKCAHYCTAIISTSALRNSALSLGFDRGVGQGG